MEFNDTKTSREERTRSRNQAGGRSYDPATPEMGLYKVVVNNMLENTYYREDRDALDDVLQAADVCADEDPEFVLELAAYARNVMGNRDVAVLLYVLAANDDRFTPEDPAEAVGVRDYGPRILRRMDEPATALAIHDQLYDGTAPKALKKGAADAIDNMLEPDYGSGAYRLRKYRQPNREVNLWDTVNRSHVRRYANVENGTYKHELLTQLMEGELPEHNAQPLPAAKTWENIVSEEGGTEEAWRKALTGDHEGSSRGMGIMARVKNIRNMLEAGLDGEEIFGPEEMDRVVNSRMFPFRMFIAYQMYKDATMGRNATIKPDHHVERFLENAIQETVANVPETWGDTAVGIDLSGSMDNALSQRGSVRYVDLSAFFGGIAINKGAYAEAFAVDSEPVTNVHYDTPALQIMDHIRNDVRDWMNTGGTNAWKFLQTVADRKDEFERVVLLTDMQAWDNRRMVGGGGVGRRRQSGNEQTVKQWVDEARDDPQDLAVYCIDLSSYGDLVTPEGYENVYNINGWNERVLEFVEYAEQPGDIIDEIRSDA